LIEQIAVVSAIVPSLFFLWYFHSRDTFPEPPKVIWTTFILGMLTVIPVLLYSFAVYPVLQRIGDPYARKLAEAFLLAAVPEEILKFLVLLFYVVRRSEFDEPMDGIVYGVAASLGFATLENLLYVRGGGLSTALMRAFTAIPCHAMLGVLMGYYVALGVFRRRGRRAAFATALLAPILIHGLYDFPLFSLKHLQATPGGMQDSARMLLLVGGFVVVLLVGLVWAFRVAYLARLEQFYAASGSGLAADPATDADAEADSGFGVPRRPAGTWRGWTLVILGTAVGSVGGSILLALLFDLVRSRRDLVPVSPETSPSGLLFAGLALLMAGSFLFLAGVRFRNRDEAWTRGRE